MVDELEYSSHFEKHVAWLQSRIFQDKITLDEDPIEGNPGILMQEDHTV